MPNTSKSQSRSRGGSKSQGQQNFSYNSANQMEKISKYFTTTSKSNPLHKQTTNSISQNDLDDFKTPKAINKISKIQQRKPISHGTKKRKIGTRNETASLKQFIESNMRQSDVNPDQLQLALALSESSYQAEHPEDYISSQEKKESFRKAFEKFGFGYGRNRTARNSGDLFQITKSNRNRKSRFKYITPILKMRTPEQRDHMIKANINAILAYNNQRMEKLPTQKGNFDIYSDTLKKYQLNKLFSLNHLNQDELQDKFRIAKLNLNWSNSCCGCLLKDWSKIQGRDVSPIREVQESFTKRSLSPDLFESDEEYLENAAIQTLNYEIEDSLVSTSDIPSEDLVSNEIQFAKLEKSPSLDFENRSYGQNHTPEKCQLFGLIHNYTGNHSFLNHQELQEFTQKSQHDNIKKDAEEVYDLTQSDCEDIHSDEEEDNKKSAKYSLSSDDETFDHHQGQVTLNTPDDEIASTQVSLRLKYSFDEEPIDWATKKVGVDNESSCNLTNVNIQDDEVLSSQVSFRLNYSFDEERIDLATNIEDNFRKDIEMESPNSESARNHTTDDEVSLEQNYGTREQIEWNHLDWDSKSSPNPPDDELLSTQTSFGCKDNFYNERNDEDQGQKANDTLEQTELYELNNLSNNVSLSSSKCTASSFFCGSLVENSDLNVTDYVAELLTQKDKEIESLTETLSQESIELSDEELHVSCVYQNTGEDIENVEPLKSSANTETPKRNKDFIIKTNNVTPMPNYDAMNTPQIVKQLDKFGLKPLKRTRGAKMLKYIYDTTHPLVKSDDGKVVKKRKTEIETSKRLSEETDLIFERTQSKKIHSCRIPFHIVWYNFVASNPQIQESILFYEPLQLEVLHSSIKEQGFKFNIQDLVTFLDRKCITFRTNQGQHRKKKP